MKRISTVGREFASNGGGGELAKHLQTIWAMLTITTRLF